MKKILTTLMTLIFVMTLVGCTQINDPDAIALQEQYDAYRMHEFSDEDLFYDYMNTFSLDTAHAGVQVHVQYHQVGRASVFYESFGIVVDDDFVNYYVITSAHIFTEELRREVVFVYDIFDQMYAAEKIVVDETLNLALISFNKTNELEVATLATTMPLEHEPVMVLSNLMDIRYQITMSYMAKHEDSNYYITGLTYDEGIIGGAVFDVNHMLIGMVDSDSGKLITASTIESFLLT